MASPLKVGQVLRGAKDVYVVARKLHDQVWTARLVN
jgi:casein kinase II subunit alpha